jgi:hypothetical protein
VPAHRAASSGLSNRPREFSSRQKKRPHNILAFGKFLEKKQHRQNRVHIGWAFPDCALAEAVIVPVDARHGSFRRAVSAEMQAGGLRILETKSKMWNSFGIPVGAAREKLFFDLPSGRPPCPRNAPMPGLAGVHLNQNHTAKNPEG